MKVGVLQFSPVLGHKKANFQKIRELCAGHRLDLLVLPELATTGYLFLSVKELAPLAEEFPGGETGDFLSTLAKDIRGYVIAGVVEKWNSRLYNSAVLYCPKGHAGTYRKVHLFDREKKLFSPGDLGFRVFDTGKVRVGIMICFDWIFPESARSLALAGAEIIAHPANLVLPYCPAAAVTRALENHVFYLLADRIGTEKKRDIRLDFIGQSMIVGTRGEVLASLESEEGLIIVDIDPSSARNKRITRRNELFSDRRPDQYRLA